MGFRETDSLLINDHTHSHSHIHQDHGHSKHHHHECDGSLPPPKDEPSDKFYIVRLLMIVVGFCVVFVSAALKINSDFYTAVFGPQDGETILFYIAIAVTVSSPFVQIIITSIQDTVTYSSRFYICFILSSLLCALFPIVLNIFPASLSYYFALAISLIVGVTNSIVKSTSISLASYYPSIYTHLLLTGKGIAPVIVIFLKATSKVVIGIISATSSPQSLQIGKNSASGVAAQAQLEAAQHDVKVHATIVSSTIFFMMAAVVPLISAVIYRVARKSMFSKFYFPSFRTRRMLTESKKSQAQPDDLNTMGANLLNNHHLTENKDQYMLKQLVMYRQHHYLYHHNQECLGLSLPRKEGRSNKENMDKSIKIYDNSSNNTKNDFYDYERQQYTNNNQLFNVNSLLNDLEEEVELDTNNNSNRIVNIYDPIFIDNDIDGIVGVLDHPQPKPYTSALSFNHLDTSDASSYRYQGSLNRNNLSNDEKYHQTPNNFQKFTKSSNSLQSASVTCDNTYGSCNDYNITTEQSTGNITPPQNKHSKDHHVSFLSPNQSMPTPSQYDDLSCNIYCGKYEHDIPPTIMKSSSRADINVNNKSSNSKPHLNTLLSFSSVQASRQQCPQPALSTASYAPSLAPSNASLYFNGSSTQLPYPDRVEATAMKTNNAVNKIAILGKVIFPFLLLVLIEAVTFALYPTILVKPKSTVTYMDTDWYHLFTLGVFAVSDFLSRIIPYETILCFISLHNMDKVIYARVLILPTFYYIVYAQSSILDSVLYPFTNQVYIVWFLTFLLAFTNGFTIIVVMRNYQHLVLDAEKSIAGSLMSIAIVLGAAIGNIVAMTVNSIFRS